MAEEFPQCEIDCIDLSPAPLTDKFPNNVKFKTMNALKGIKYEDNTFDYIYMRLLCSSVPETYWPVLVKDLARVCSSGGTIELVETSAHLENAGPLGQEVTTWIDTVCRSRGANLCKVWQIPQMIQEAALFEFPLGEWCDQVGRQGWLDVLSLVNSLSAKICLHAINVANRVYWKYGVFVGRKP
ncbi:hypothetical protein BDF19DRAFT_436784 [Syncephalis fuscata]|nr:hypothetical protein BDF19DRAFT_436784 [Syncephalis fuscata]